MDNPESLLRGRRRWGAFFAFWSLMVVVTTLQSHYQIAEMGDKAISWGVALRRSAEEWYSWGLLSIGVVWFAGRVRLEPCRWVRWAAAHFAASVVVAAAYIAILSWLLAGQDSVQNPGHTLEFGEVFRKFIVHYLLWNMTIYWMIVGVHHGWTYYRRFLERESQSRALAHELVQARLEVLRMQLNPHFLFNTLNTVSALIHDSPEVADRTVVRLSELLRRTLDMAESQEVPLREEARLLESYLEIEKTRFGDRLSLQTALDADTLEARVPSMVLQPLVENSIRHGIEPLESGGRIVIVSRREADRLVITVTDNGAGPAPAPDGGFGEGVGLSNTRSRLCHLYGKEHDFAIRPVAGGGTEVRLSIPFHTEPLAPNPADAPVCMPRVCPTP